METNTRNTFAYLDIYNAIKNDIVMKKYRENDLLPTENELMEQFGTGRNTVRHAMEMLRRDGLVETKRGSGTFVSAAENQYRNSDFYKKLLLEDLDPGLKVTREFFHGTSSETEYSHPAIDTAPASAQIASTLGIPEGEPVHRVQRILRMQGVPFEYQIQYFRRDVVSSEPALLQNSPRLYDDMEYRLKLHPVQAEEHFSARKADFFSSNLLNLELGDAVLYIYRIVFNENGPFEVRESYLTPQQTGYVLHQSFGNR